MRSNARHADMINFAVRTFGRARGGGHKVAATNSGKAFIVISIPLSIAREMEIVDGDRVTLAELPSGCFLLLPSPSGTIVREVSSGTKGARGMTVKVGGLQASAPRVEASIVDDTITFPAGTIIPA